MKSKRKSPGKMVKHRKRKQPLPAKKRAKVEPEPMTETEPETKPVVNKTDVCRTCMAAKRTKRQKSVSLFSKLGSASVASIITDCTGVEITENDSLPGEICTECFETVKLLLAFTTTVRNSDSKMRCKVEAADDSQEADTSVNDISANDLSGLKFEPEVDIEPDHEEVSNKSDEDNEEQDNETDSDWKESGEEVKRTAKRKKLGLKSKPTPQKRRSNTAPKNKLEQSEQDLELNEEEQELFTTIIIQEGDHICCGCLQVFSSAEDLEDHRQKNHIWKNENLMKPSPKIPCNGCLRRYDSPRSLKLHLDRVRMLKNIWECNKCNFRFKAADKRRKHIRIHTEGAPIAMLARISEGKMKEFGWLCCAMKCGLSFPTEEDLIGHSHTAHLLDKQEADMEAADKPEQCQVCFRRFEDRKGVVGHQRRLYKRKNFQCSLCGDKFSTTVDLNKHEMKEHGSSGFPCKICNKMFTQKYSMINHLKYMHTEEKNHQCNVCGMTFRMKGGLKTHMSNHVEVPQFKCEVCGKMFKAKLHLRYHMRTHTGEKPYKCRYCDHAFANNTNFRRHEMTHTGEKPHKCSRCDKSFILRRTLVEHEKTHEKGAVPKRTQRAQKAQQVHVEKLVDFSEEESVIIEEVEYECFDENEEYEEIIDDDEEITIEESTMSLGNRPISIRVINPPAPPSQTSQIATTESTSVDGAPTVVYDVIPSTKSGNFSYILKFK